MVPLLTAFDFEIKRKRRNGRPKIDPEVSRQLSMHPGLRAFDDPKWSLSADGGVSSKLAFEQLPELEERRDTGLVDS